MKILGIETSCDETAAAIVENGTRVLSTVIATSKKAFEHTTGVIPEEAARKQVECMIPVLKKTLRDANISFHGLDAIAVTRGPGLLGSLLTGTMTARVLGSVWKKPLIGVHHTLGHLTSTWLGAEEEILFPLITLSASGGHTDLWLRTSHTGGRLLGRTLDDAAGEAFDKGASLLGLPYPGGPAISAAGREGNPRRYPFPHPLSKEQTLDFSFSGLKTALRYLLRDLKLLPASSKEKSNIPAELLTDLAASYEHALCAHLTDRIDAALSIHPDIKEVHIVGGVSANDRLRSLAKEVCDKKSVTLRTPARLAYCTDNAAMIASAGFFLHQEIGDRAYENFETAASVPLENLIP